MRVSSNTRPNAVTIERTHDNRLYARLVENVVESTRDNDDGTTEISYDFDEYIFEDEWSDALEKRIRKVPGKFLRMAKAGGVGLGDKET